MELNLFFNCFVVVLIGVLVYLNFKAYIDTIRSTKHFKQTYSKLASDFLNEEKKQVINSQNLILLDEIHDDLFKRLFKITRDILLMQKTILNNHFQ